MNYYFAWQPYVSVADQILNQESETLLTEMSDAELLQFVSLDITRATAEE